MINDLIRAGFWKRVQGGFQILALAEGDDVRSLVEEYAKMSPAERFSVRGVKIGNRLLAAGRMLS